MKSPCEPQGAREPDSATAEPEKAIRRAPARPADGVLKEVEMSKKLGSGKRIKGERRPPLKARKRLAAKLAKAAQRQPK